MSLGPHAVFIWLCYAAVALGVAAMITVLAWNGRRLRAELDGLEASSGRRRDGSADADATSTKVEAKTL